MENVKKIGLSFDLRQVCNDILANSNLISKQIQDDANSDIKADIATPDGEETRSIICRAVTEAFDKVKYACQRYMTTGRTVDDNRLERLAYKVDGTSLTSVTDEDEPQGLATEDETVKFEVVKIDLEIENYNTSATGHLKSSIHKYVVDYTMFRFLQNLVADKAGEYLKLADETDYPNVIQALNSRERYTRRVSNWL